MNIKEKNAEKLGLKTVYKKKRNSKSLYKVKDNMGVEPQTPASPEVLWI